MSVRHLFGSNEDANCRPGDTVCGRKSKIAV